LLLIKNAIKIQQCESVFKVLINLFTIVVRLMRSDRDCRALFH